MDAYLVEQTNNDVSVKLTGDLTAVVVGNLQGALQQKLKDGMRALVVDLSHAKMIDSSGMGLLIAASNSLTPLGGQICVTNVCPDIFRLLQSMRLTARLNVGMKPE